MKRKSILLISYFVLNKILIVQKWNVVYPWIYKDINLKSRKSIRKSCQRSIKTFAIFSWLFFVEERFFRDSDKSDSLSKEFSQIRASNICDVSLVGADWSLARRTYTSRGEWRSERSERVASGSRAESRAARRAVRIPLPATTFDFMRAPSRSNFDRRSWHADGRRRAGETCPRFPPDSSTEKTRRNARQKCPTVKVKRKRKEIRYIGLEFVEGFNWW